MTYGAVLAMVGWFGCAGEKEGPTETGDTAAGETFTVLGDRANLPAAAILSVWGSSSEDVFMVGSDDGAGPVVLHWDGATWSRLATGSTGDLWWVFGVSGLDTVWMSGEGGRLLTYSRSAGTFTEEVVAEPAFKMFGVWASAADDVWVVGGDVNGNADGVVVHWDGAAWTTSWTADRNDQSPDTRRQVFKIWGSSPDDIFVCGTGALVAHYDGAAWESLQNMGYRANTYFTASGTGPDDVYLVGGEGNAQVLHWDGAAWEDLSPPPDQIVPIMNGVSASEAHGTAMCGQYGSIYWRTGTGWEADPRPRATSRDFHACWVDEQGAVWAVGGDLTTLTEGVVVYGGESVAPISLSR
ncbi:MAG: hypothetical protein ABMA64_14150 [Myxococcota bacterium]